MKMYVVEEDPGRRGNSQNYSHYLFMIYMQAGRREEGHHQLWPISYGVGDKEQGEKLHNYEGRKGG